MSEIKVHPEKQNELLQLNIVALVQLTRYFLPGSSVFIRI